MADGNADPNRSPLVKAQPATVISDSESIVYPSPTVVPSGDGSVDSVVVGQVAEFTASDAFCARMKEMIAKEDVQAIIASQNQALSRFEKTNEKFQNFNELSTLRYDVLHQRFSNHTKMLLDMKKDLDIVFRRIRTLKSKLHKQYEHAFIANIQKLEKLTTEDEDEKEEKPKAQTQGDNREEVTKKIDSNQVLDGSEQESKGACMKPTNVQPVLCSENETDKRQMESSALAISSNTMDTVQIKGANTDMHEASGEPTFKLRPTLSSSDDSDLEDLESDESSSDSFYSNQDSTSDALETDDGKWPAEGNPQERTE